MPLYVANRTPLLRPWNAPNLATLLIFDLALNETSGTRADSSGNAQSFTANGTISSAAGKVNTGLSGSGTSGDYLSRTSEAALVTGDIDFWVSCWVKLSSIAADQGFISKWATSNQEYTLWFDSAAKRFKFSVSSTGSNTTTATLNQTYDVQAGAWYLLNAWHDSVANVIGVQVNNGYKEETSYSSGVYASGTAPVTIGAKGTANPLNGVIDMARFWKRVPTESDLMALWAGGAGAEGTISYNPNERQIIFDGNSLTWGVLRDPASAFPAQTMALLGKQYTWTWRNFGLASQQTTTMVGVAATRVDPLYRKHVSHNILVAWEITNDLNAGVAAATALTNFTTYCAARRAAGWKVIVLTVLPRTSASGTFEADRQTINTSIRANWATYADALADVAADSRIGDSGDQNDTTYYLADAVHTAAAGDAVVAGIVAAVVAAL